MSKVVQHPAFTKLKAKQKRDAEVVRQWSCKVCGYAIGVETSDAIQISTAPRIKGVRVIGGSKQWVCAHCWKRGVTTPVM